MENATAALEDFACADDTLFCTPRDLQRDDSTWTQWTFSSPYWKKIILLQQAPPLPPLSAPPPVDHSLRSADSSISNGDECDIFLSVCTLLTLSAERNLLLMETKLQCYKKRLCYQIYDMGSAILMGPYSRKNIQTGRQRYRDRVKSTASNEDPKEFVQAVTSHGECACAYSEDLKLIWQSSKLLYWVKQSTQVCRAVPVWENI